MLTIGQNGAKLDVFPVKWLGFVQLLNTEHPPPPPPSRWCSAVNEVNGVVNYVVNEVNGVVNYVVNEVNNLVVSCEL